MTGASFQYHPTPKMSQQIYVPCRTEVQLAYVNLSSLEPNLRDGLTADDWTGLLVEFRVELTSVASHEAVLVLDMDPAHSIPMRGESCGEESKLGNGFASKSIIPFYKL